jgi:hypothetical protein
MEDSRYTQATFDIFETQWQQGLPANAGMVVAVLPAEDATGKSGRMECAPALRVRLGLKKARYREPAAMWPTQVEGTGGRGVHRDSCTRAAHRGRRSRRSRRTITAMLGRDPGGRARERHIGPERYRVPDALSA